MKTYRVTALELYEMCPNCFYLQYVLGVFRPKNKNTEMGSNLHEAIKRYHRGENPEPILNTDYLKQLFNLYKDVYAPQAPDQMVEYQFIMEVTKITETDRRLVLRPLKMTGTIDRIADGWIYEHKTSSSRYTQEQVENHFQATAYSYWYWKFYGEYPKGVRFNVFVKNKRPYMMTLDTYFDIRDFKRWYTRLERIAEGIKNKNWTPSRGWRHNYDICESRNSVLNATDSVEDISNTP